MTTADADQPAAEATSGPSAPGGSPDIRSLVRLGWLMSQLYYDMPDRPAGQRHGLPTVNELGREDRIDLTFTVLDELLAPLAEASLTCAAARAAWTGPAATDLSPPPASADERGPQAAGDLARRTWALHESLDALNTQILRRLSVIGVVELTAYATGRQLADSCRVPHGQLALLRRQLNRYRIAEVQANLAALASRLPNRSAQAVSRSLDHWQEWAAADEADTWTAAGMASLLGRQGRVWQSLLTGTTDPETLLTVDAWLAAADSGALTASRAGTHLARRFWQPLLLVAGVVAFLVVLSLAKAPGEAKVWTSLVSIAAGLGVTGASLRTAAKRGVGVVRSQVADALELEALGWAATISPMQAPAHSVRFRLPGHERGTSAAPTPDAGPPTAHPIDGTQDVQGLTPRPEGLALFGPTAPVVHVGDQLELDAVLGGGTFVVTETQPVTVDGSDRTRVTYVRAI